MAADANSRIATCSPNFLILESIGTFDGPQMSVVSTAIGWEDGLVSPPTAPGLAMELTNDVIASNPCEGSTLHLDMVREPLVH